MTMRKIFIYIFILILGFALGRLSAPVQNVDRSESSEREQTQSNTNLTSTTQFEPETMWVESNIVNVRSNPGLDAAIEEKLFRGDSVVVQDTTGEWARVDLGDNMEGWIFSSLLSESRVPPLPAVQVRGAEQSVVEKNNLWWRYSYQVDLVVNRATRDHKKVIIKFVDSEGFALDNDITYLPMFNRPQEHIIRDSKLIDLPLAENIDSLVISIE